MTETEALACLSNICGALPEAERRLSGRHADFRVRGRPFGYFLDDHHGDGIVALAFKPAPSDYRVLLGSQPGRFYRPAYIGARGWLAVRLDSGAIDWTEIAEFVLDSYRVAAPKRLAALIENADPARLCARDAAEPS